MDILRTLLIFLTFGLMLHSRKNNIAVECKVNYRAVGKLKNSGSSSDLLIIIWTYDVNICEPQNIVSKTGQSP